MRKKDELTSMERFNTAILLKEGDRIPIAPLMDYYYANCAGLTPAQYVLGDFRIAKRAVKITYERHGCDLDMVHIPIGRVYAFYEPIPAAHSGFFSELIIPDLKNGSLQFIEKPILKVENFSDIMENGFSQLWRYIPPNKIFKTQMDMFQIAKFIHYWEKKRKVPVYTSSANITPLETLSYLCGIKRWSRYLRKNRDELKQMCDFMIKGFIANDLFLKKMIRVNRSYICLERVSNSFISAEIFEELVLPYIKQIVNINNKLGYTNLFHMDTNWTPFLKYFLELPKNGRYILHLENTDIIKAKEILGDRMCLMGNVNSSLLAIGVPKDIDKYCKHIIENCMEGGGFILGSGCEVASDAKFENVQAMISAGKKYGVYRK
ncbi:MAG: uroporphyrinogen decarboxylase family protein [Candidatus Helarchaeota archaeon]